MDNAKLAKLAQQKIVDDINKLKKAAKTKKDADAAEADKKYKSAKASVNTFKDNYINAYTLQVLFRLGNQAD